METKDLFLSKLGGGQEAFIAFMPSLGVRSAITAAWYRALGYRPATDEQGAETLLMHEDLADVADISAIAGAVFGVAVLDHPKNPQYRGASGPGRFREFGRDAVDYGEAVTTWLWDQGYQEAQEIADIAIDLINWWNQDTFKLHEAVGQEKEVFAEAQQ